MTDTPQTEALVPLTSLTKMQRRVLGVLIEKGFTTPESYPLTIKALTSGCNQKNNRHPLTNYEEFDLEEPLNQLRELGLVAVVHTETGRTERFRHWMRRRLTVSEPQLAILAELLLRGRQAMGELRARASRMAPIDSQEQLRDELLGLIRLNLVQSDGPLDRRGAEIDHALYEPREQQGFAQRPALPEPVPHAPSAPRQPPKSAVESVAAAPPASRIPSGLPAATEVAGGSSPLADRVRALELLCAELRGVNNELRSELDATKDGLATLSNSLDNLRRDLGA